MLKVFIIGLFLVSCTHTKEVSKSEKNISETKETLKSEIKEVSKSEIKNSETKEILKSSEAIKQIVVSVPGMVCQMCVQGMKKAFKDSVKDPEKDISVNLDTKKVTLNPNKELSDSEIKEKVQNAGYNAKDIKRI